MHYTTLKWALSKGNSHTIVDTAIVDSIIILSRMISTVQIRFYELNICTKWYLALVRLHPIPIHRTFYGVRACMVLNVIISFCVLILDIVFPPDDLLFGSDIEHGIFTDHSSIASECVYSETVSVSVNSTLYKHCLYGVCIYFCCFLTTTQITKFMGPTWGPPGSCWTQVGPMLIPWALLSG